MACSARAVLRAASSVRARPSALKSQLKITRLSNTIAVPPTIHASTRSRGFIRLYQAGIIAAFPLVETVRDRSPKYGEQPSRIERFAAPDSSLPYRWIDKRAQQYWLLHLLTFGVQIDYRQ